MIGGRFDDLHVRKIDDNWVCTAAWIIYVIIVHNEGKESKETLCKWKPTRTHLRFVELAEELVGLVLLVQRPGEAPSRSQRQRGPRGRLRHALGHLPVPHLVTNSILHHHCGHEHPGTVTDESEVKCEIRAFADAWSARGGCDREFDAIGGGGVSGSGGTACRGDFKACWLSLLTGINKTGRFRLAALRRCVKARARANSNRRGEE
jgi:hypothetical protein